jgi:integrase
LRGVGDELSGLLDVTHGDFPDYYNLVLFFADTGARLGEAIALRWIDVDLDLGVAHIRRSYSMGRNRGPAGARTRDRWIKSPWTGIAQPRGIL